MLGRAILIVALMMSAGVAGCIGGKKDDGVKPQSTNTTGTVNANDTSQPNGGQISAFKETNKTETTGIGALMHAHDYWKGATRKVIYSAPIGLIPFPLMPDGKPTGTAIADFNIPPGTEHNLTFEGTDHLELLMTNVTYAGEANPVDGKPIERPAGYTFFFDYLTAADEPGKLRTGGQLESGKPFILPIKPTETDMPHSEASLWVFRLYSGEPQAINFDLKITAVKGNAIANWPPHPNLYADKAERLIFDADVKEHSGGTAQITIDGKDVEWINPERVISWGTDTVDVTVTNPVFTPTGPSNPVTAPDHYILEVHNATYIPLLGNGDQAGQRAEDKATDGKTWRFHLTSDPQSYDSPYGQKSRWGFRFVPRFGSDPTNCLAATQGTPAGRYYNFAQEFLVGCQFVPWEMTYHVKIVAHGHSTATGVDGAVDPNAAAQQAPTPPTK